ncbi:MAG: DUF5067 domain-containing protein [Oscillospiraceae bacterium]|nr:DUF5067 domain-containing protein [Oscillospiraceae bacterium]
MRKLALLMAASLALAVPVFGSDTDLESRIAALEERVAALEAQIGGAPDGVSKAPDQEAIDPGTVETGMVSEGCSLSYKRAELGKTYNGEDCVILYFDYVNGSGETSAAGFDFYVKVFQNNREQDSATVSDNPAIKEKNTEYRSGAGPIEVAYASMITDTSDIIVNISSMKDFFAEDVEFSVSLE